MKLKLLPAAIALALADQYMREWREWVAAKQLAERALGDRP